MKKALKIGLGVIAVFALLVILFPGDQRPGEIELCGRGHELMSQAPGTSREQAHKLACDHKAIREGYDALKREQEGS